jgi:CheY-like chemotaxis protein
MSETLAIPPLGAAETKHTPTVYFIDDSATMREVIKIAFRRENINIIACADAASALGQFEQHPPDAVITDVIMPDQDGYSVCSQIKQNPQFSKTPVILMSGVVNKSVADRAVAVQADELVRKPFQPQELIGRVRHLLNAANPPAPALAEHAPAVSALDSLFARPHDPARVAPISAVLQQPSTVALPVPTETRPTESVWPRALADAFLQQGSSSPTPASSPATPPPPRPASQSLEVHRLRAEIIHLELLIKKLQTELQIERQYNQALEQQVRALTQGE